MQGEKKKVISQWLIPTIALVAVMSGMLFNFTSKSIEMAALAIERDMIVVASQYAADLRKELQTMAESAIPVSLAIAQRGKADLELMSALCEYSPAYMVIYCSKQGRGITEKGVEVDLSKGEYFTPLMESAIHTYLYVADDGVTGGSAIAQVVPIPNDPGNVLIVYYPLTALAKSIKGSEIDGNVIYILADEEGNILAHNEHGSKYLEKDNLNSALTEGGYGDEIRKMSVRLKNGVSGSIKTVLEGEGRSLVYTPFNMNQWSVILGVNQPYVTREENKEWEFTRNTIFQLVIIISAFLLLVILMSLVNKMRNTENTKKLEEKADTDLLTGLNNKLATERKIKEYMETHPHEQSMMFVLDIDNFKKINDTMGHAFGDEVLRSLGSQITAMFRVTDIVGRVGGDEFIILLKSLKDDHLLKKEGEKVARFFHDFQVGEYVKYSATASIGVAVFPKDGKDFEAMYKAADQALYSAKKRGKNQLVFYHDYIDPVVIR